MQFKCERKKQRKMGKFLSFSFRFPLYNSISIVYLLRLMPTAKRDERFVHDFRFRRCSTFFNAVAGFRRCRFTKSVYFIARPISKWKQSALRRVKHVILLFGTLRNSHFFLILFISLSLVPISSLRFFFCIPSKTRARIAVQSS